MYFYIAVMVGSWLLLVISWAFFRKPGVDPFTVVWKPWRPSDYVTQTGVVLWAVGYTVFIAGWILGFTGMIR
jgi:hypothetical protein